ncbi:MAG TPA: SPOR domain-containing protein [Bacteroidales bacterium]|nr:SPOR domain-containing protein [Bacteroidales bacterium]HPS51586.1 SPOR domain-containing protein [Bacteroidales bacterium]
MTSIHSHILILILFIIQNTGTKAQPADTSAVTPGIVQDERVDQLVEKHIRINQNLKTIDGFRIQVFSDSGNNSKTKAQATQDELSARYPQMGVYLTFKSPNYKVRIGDFRSRLDAQRFLNELAPDYPNAFIITDQINIPKIDP